MGENKVIKEQLRKIYGDGCFFERAKIAEKIEKMGGIKTYKQFLSERYFKGKKIRNMLTLHHLKHKSEGGATTIENGANVREIPHQYIHSLPRNQEEVINNMFRDFKIALNVMDLRVSKDHIDINGIRQKTLENEKDCWYIPVFKNVKNYKQKKGKFNRNKEKQEMRRIIDELYSEDEER